MKDHLRIKITINSFLVVSALFAFGLVSDALSASKTFKDCQACPQMVSVPAGKAAIGLSEDVIGLTQSMRNRTLAQIKGPFSLSATEITRAQFAAFVEAEDYKPIIGRDEEGAELLGCQFFNGAWGNVVDHSWNNPGFVQRGNEPVVCVSHADAQAYVQWLSKKTGRSYRLPSAVEFEYAAAGGSSAAWFWGSRADLACDHANVADYSWAKVNDEKETFPCDDGFVFTSPAGHFKANAYGLYDMIGNAWEWVADCWVDDLANTPLDGRALGLDSEKVCTYRPVVGGGWASGPQWSRASTRSRDPAHFRSYFVGFRVALTPR